MKVIFLCDKYIEQYEVLIQKIKEGVSLKENLESGIVDIKITSSNRVNSKQKYDIYVILSDDAYEIEVLCKNIEEKNSILVITQNLASSHILRCVEITPNICYAKNSIQLLLKKICLCYICMKEEFDEK